MHPTGMKETEKISYKQLKSYIITHRKLHSKGEQPIHFFVKYQSYGISIVELELFPKHITHVLMIEHKKDRKDQYLLSKIEKWRKGLTWNNILVDNVPDPQKHIPVRDMERYETLDDVPEPKEVTNDKNL